MTSARILLPLAILAVPVLADEPLPPDPYVFFNSAVDSFVASNYSAAVDSFARAAEAAPAQGLSPAQALFDKGIALEAAADAAADTAAAAFLEAARSPNAPLPLQTRSYYNAGNLLLRQAMETIDNPEMPVIPLPAADSAAPDMPPSQPTDPAKLLEAALASLQNAIELDPANVDAKASYELASRIQQQLQEQQQQQQQNQQQSSDANQDQSDDQQQSQSQDQQEQEGDQQKQQEQSQSQESQPSQESQSSPQSQESPQSPSQESTEPQPSEQMTPEEAALLLDAMRAREQSQRDQLKPLFGRPIPVENDW